MASVGLWGNTSWRELAVVPIALFPGLHHGPVLITCSIGGTRLPSSSPPPPPKQMTAVVYNVPKHDIHCGTFAIFICTCATDVIQVGGEETELRRFNDIKLGSFYYWS